MSIQALERYASDLASIQIEKIQPISNASAKSIAVVGGGPSGLSCSYFLSLLGHRVTLFEAETEPGGVLRWGIPEYRLPKSILKREIRRILSLPIEMKTGVTVGKDIPFGDLECFDAIFSPGAGLSPSLGIEGEGVEPDPLNIDPAYVRRRLGPKTPAILAVHHAGLAADVDGLQAVAREAGVPIIEDCAQAWGCEYRGRAVGTFTEIGAFSLNHFKHIECGSGGMVVTDDDRLRYRASLFLDKCYQREEGIRNPFFLAPNYQMTELQGAVALAQLERVDAVAARRSALGARLGAILAECPGVFTQPVPAGSRHSYFLYLVRLDLDWLGCTADDFSRALAAEGVPNAAHLITGGRPVHLYDVFVRRSAFPGTEYPFVPGRVYRPCDCPVAEAAFSTYY